MITRGIYLHSSFFVIIGFRKNNVLLCKKGIDCSMATIKDIAKQAGVSAATVSRVINNSGYVSTDTRNTVEKAISELKYVPNRHAQNLRRGSTRNLGIITSTLGDTVLARIEPFMQFANDANYTTTLFNTYKDPQRELETLDRLKSKELDGIFLIYRTNEWSAIEPYTQFGPIVTLHNIENDDLNIPSVFIDHYEGYKLILEDLWANGARSFINILGSSTGVNTKRRIKAYFDFCEEHHIEPHDIKPFLDITGNNGGLRAVEMIEEMDLRPDAIIAHSDQVASVIVSQYNKKGIKMPEDVSVVGFDNLIFSELMDFTSVDYSIDEQGKNACRLLLNELESDSYDLVPLEFNLIKRGTTK